MRRLLMILCPLLLVVVEGSPSAGASRPPGWDDATHGRDAVPDYDLVFSADRVNRLDVTVSAADWAPSPPERSRACTFAQVEAHGRFSDDAWGRRAFFENRRKEITPARESVDLAPPGCRGREETL